jgi:phosphinothricin acetyltransferase
MTDGDAAAVLAIYQAGIDEGNATFETQVPDWTAFCASKIMAFSAVAVDDEGTVLGLDGCQRSLPDRPP